MQPTGAALGENVASLLSRTPVGWCLGSEGLAKGLSCSRVWPEGAPPAYGVSGMAADTEP